MEGYVRATKTPLWPMTQIPRVARATLRCWLHCSGPHCYKALWPRAARRARPPATERKSGLEMRATAGRGAKGTGSANERKRRRRKCVRWRGRARGSAGRHLCGSTRACRARRQSRLRQKRSHRGPCRPRHTRPLLPAASAGVRVGRAACMSGRCAEEAAMGLALAVLSSRRRTSEVSAGDRGALCRRREKRRACSRRLCGEAQSACLA